jgi:hypothetical protein
MVATVEMRWFVEGTLPAEVVNWYEEAVGLVDWQERVDRYVRPAARDGLNVKWREGHIEIKRLVEEIGNHQWADVAGTSQRWRKWSFPLSEELPLAATGNDWIPVSKHRTVRTFAHRGDKMMLMKPGEHLPHGCSVEITAIDSHGRKWWTLALEAFGPDLEAREMLLQTGARIFGDEGAPPLTRATSMSYVRWLWERGQGRE